jgi:hypothetical protein
MRSGQKQKKIMRAQRNLKELHKMGTEPEKGDPQTVVTVRVGLQPPDKLECRPCEKGPW